MSVYRAEQSSGNSTNLSMNEGTDLLLSSLCYARVTVSEVGDSD